MQLPAVQVSYLDSAATTSMHQAQSLPRLSCDLLQVLPLRMTQKKDTVSDAHAAAHLLVACLGRLASCHHLLLLLLRHASHRALHLVHALCCCCCFLLQTLMARQSCCDAVPANTGRQQRIAAARHYEPAAVAVTEHCLHRRQACMCMHTFCCWCHWSRSSSVIPSSILPISARFFSSDCCLCSFSAAFLAFLFSSCLQIGESETSHLAAAAAVQQQQQQPAGRGHQARS